MTAPKTPFIRRGELFAWLLSLGFARGEVKKWITAGVISRRLFPSTADKKKHRPPKAYYHVPTVARELRIDDPFQPNPPAPNTTKK